MKKSLGIGLALFGASLAVVAASAQHYCQTRWIGLAFAVSAVVVFVRKLRQRDPAEADAIALVVLAAVVIFNAAFFYLAARHCH